MSERLKVYGWYGRRAGAPGWHEGTREIMAAPSKAAVIRANGSPRGGLFNLDETGNAGEITTAMAKPGVIFWAGQEEYPPVWREAEVRRA